MENIWAAQRRPASPQEPPRAPNIVDSTGCIITRGFVVPSRTTSFDSAAEESTTSTGSAGTIFSPIEEAPPGFRWPNIPAPHRESPPPASVYRTSKSTGSIDVSAVTAKRCLDDRRETWHSAFSIANYGSRWEDEELADTICKAPSRSAYKTLDPFPHIVDKPRTKRPLMNTRRTKSEQLNPKCLIRRETRHGRTLEDKEQKVKWKSTNVSPRFDSEEAIESANTSNNEENSATADTTHLKSRMRARVDRVSYAERRARSDARAHGTEAPEVLSKAVSSASPYDETAIESDGEDDSGRTICSVDDIIEVLQRTEIHGSRNSDVMMSNLQSREEQPLKSSACATVRLSKMNIQLALKAGPMTEVTMEASGVSPIMQRDLRPSRSRPRPSKGVLKSRSCSQTETSKPGKQEQDSRDSNMSTHAKLPQDDVVVRFAPAA